jgi:hypothetical protein
MSSLKANGNDNLSPGDRRFSFFGVDFSGAEDAGRKIWISYGIYSAGSLTIKSCNSLARLTGSKERDFCLRFLRDQIASNPDAVFGLDFPFGLPLEITGGQAWEDFILQFPGKYPDAEAFREDCRRQTGNREFKRRSEKEHKAPFSPYNLRLYRQTYYGIRDILHPLVMEKLACAPPMQTVDPDRPVVVEICPACLLKKMGMYRPYNSHSAGLPSHIIFSTVLSHQVQYLP